MRGAFNRLLVASLGLFLSTAPAARAEQSGRPAPLPTLPIAFAVVQAAGEAVVDASFLADQVGSANAVFGPHGITFVAAKVRPLAERYAALETRADRHALGGETKAGVINCFVVASLRDVDDPSLYRRGVHWRPRGYPGRHFVILSSVAGPTVLAHELGHFFGTREHSEVAGNIMSYDRGEVPPFLDEAQAERARRFAARFLATREILPASVPLAGQGD
jgi:hypothetical protein